MKTKMIISTKTIQLAERSLINRKIVMRLDELVIREEGYLVKTTAFTVVPEDQVIPIPTPSPGMSNMGLMMRLQFLNYKENNYSNEQIDGLFSMIDINIENGEIPFSERIREIMSEALLLSVVNEQTFGFGEIGDWEFVTEEMINPPLPEPETPEPNTEE